MKQLLLADILLGGEVKTKKKVVKKKVVKKAATDKVKDLSMFDEDAPNIFDDPLSALGNS